MVQRASSQDAKELPLSEPALPNHDALPPLPRLRELVPRLLAGLALLLAVVVGLATLLRVPITTFSTWLIGAAGWPGLTLSFAMTDLVPVLTHSAVLLVGHAGGLGLWTAFLAACVGAFLGVLLAWSVGRLFGQSSWIQRLLERYWIGPFLRRYGILAVAIASLTPIPDSLCVIGTGAARLPLWHPMVGALVRVPKILVYLVVIRAGWSLGA